MKVRSNTKTRLLAVALSTATFAAAAVPAVSQIHIQIGREPPPPMRYERRPPPPGAGFVWEDGFWRWDGYRYAWVPGHWERPPYPGAYWSHPHYDRYEDGWHFHEGHWDREDHGDHHDWDHDRDHAHDHDHDRH